MQKSISCVIPKNSPKDSSKLLRHLRATLDLATSVNSSAKGLLLLQFTAGINGSAECLLLLDDALKPLAALVLVLGGENWGAGVGHFVDGVVLLLVSWLVVCVGLSRFELM